VEELYDQKLIHCWIDLRTVKLEKRRQRGERCVGKSICLRIILHIYTYVYANDRACALFEFAFEKAVERVGRM